MSHRTECAASRASTDRQTSCVVVTADAPAAAAAAAVVWGQNMSRLRQAVSGVVDLLCVGYCFKEFIAKPVTCDGQSMEPTIRPEGMCNVCVLC